MNMYVTNTHTEGKVLLSKENWFDHFTPFLHESSHTHRHAHTALTYVTERTQGTKAQPWEEKLKCWLLGQESRWKQHPSKSVAFLSASPPINPSFPPWIATPVLLSILHPVSFSSHLFWCCGSLSPSLCLALFLSLHAFPGILSSFPDGGWSRRHLTPLPTYGAPSPGREALDPPSQYIPPWLAGVQPKPDQVPVGDSSLLAGDQVPLCQEAGLKQHTTDIFKLWFIWQVWTVCGIRSIPCGLLPQCEMPINNVHFLSHLTMVISFH